MSASASELVATYLQSFRKALQTVRGTSNPLLLEAITVSANEGTAAPLMPDRISEI